MTSPTDVSKFEYGCVCSASFAIPALFLVSPDKLDIKDTNMMVFSSYHYDQFMKIFRLIEHLLAVHSLRFLYPNITKIRI